MDLEPCDPLEKPARVEVRRQESDDSDAEGGLGNVTRIVLRPPGHSGKAKRGHLCFDASFEGGNLGRVDFISEYEYDLFIRPDTCNPRFRLWFNFVVDNVRTDQRVVFNIVNLCKTKTLFQDGMTPLVKTSSRPKWQRLPQKFVYYHKSPEHRNHYILSFAFAFDREEDVYQFAFSFPYSYSRLQKYLDLLEERDYSFLRRELLANSLQNRRLDVITISNPGSVALSGPKRGKLVVVLARSHPGETPSSFVAQGLLDFMVSNHPIAEACREHFILKVVPMINPDGVFLGNHRSSLMGYDLNRQWNQISPWSHPTLHGLRNYLIELNASKTLDLDIVIDIHSHSSLMGTFIYGNAYDDVYRFERHILFPKLLAHNAEDYNSTNTMYNRDSSKSGTARRFLCEVLKASVDVYTLEVSFLGYNHPISNASIAYNQDGYFRLGRNLARTFFDYYKATGVIPSSLTISMPSGRRGSPTSRKKKKGKSRSISRSRLKPKDRSPSCADDKTEEEDIESLEEKAIVELSALTKENEFSDSSSSSEGYTNQHSQNHVPRKLGKSRLYRRHSAPRVQRSNSDFMKKITKETGTVRFHNVCHHTPFRPLKISYKDFDFSEIRNKEKQKIYTDKKLHTDFFKSKPKPKSMKKIGGGGIISQAKKKNIPPRIKSTNFKEIDLPSPFLTIIDFNMLIHPGLEHKRRGKYKRKNSHLAGKNRYFTSKRKKYKRKVNLALQRGAVTDYSGLDFNTSDSDIDNQVSEPELYTYREFSNESECLTLNVWPFKQS